MGVEKPRVESVQPQIEFVREQEERRERRRRQMHVLGGIGEHRCRRLADRLHQQHWIVVQPESGKSCRMHHASEEQEREEQSEGPAAHHHKHDRFRDPKNLRGGKTLTMSKAARALVFAAIALLALASCHKEQKAGSAPEPETFQFVVYPGAQYLQELTDLDKRAASSEKPNEPVPPLAIYDTDAPLDTVADYDVKQYRYGKGAPDATNNFSAARPQA